MSSERLLICPANFSEGRDSRTVHDIAAAGESLCALLDVHVDSDHHRCVITFAGSPEELANALTQAAGVAMEKIDLRTHAGVHPRMGAVDVVPLVPHGSTPMQTAVDVATECARRIAGKFLIPCFLYEFADPAGRSLPDVRKGAFSTLLPDFGPSEPHVTAGAAAVGAREPLVAYNVNLDTAEVDIAANIARELRSLPHVRALGFALARKGVVQVSCNLLQPQTTGIAQVFDAITEMAARRGVEVLESEVVGLTPEIALAGRDPAALKFARYPKILERVVGV